MLQPFKLIHKNTHLRFRQNGAVLILLAFILGLGVAAFLIKSINAANFREAQNLDTYQTLGEAKQALIAWSIAHPNWPGVMPFPDRKEVSNPNYDGKSDCVTFGLDTSHLLGKLPLLGDVPCIDSSYELGLEFKEPSGERFWYAVSMNLIRINSGATPIINPSIITNPVYPWLKVLDRNGILISDRVAAVIIAPGNPLENQSRSSTAPNSKEFLDTFQIAGTTYSNADYDSENEDFIISVNSRNVSNTDTFYTKPYYFNDLLVFITIDELMSALNSRAASEASILINQYKAKSEHYPYAAELGASGGYVSAGVNKKGMLPIDITDSCNCSSANNCSCSFNLIESVTFTRGGGTEWDSSIGCTHSNETCTCSGAGSCSKGAKEFNCNSNGLCTHNVGGSNNQYTYTLPSYADIFSVDGDCTISGIKINCTDEGTFNVGLKEPSWFKTNLWQDYIYYEWSEISDLQVGTKTALSAILINAGNKTTSEIGKIQSRPTNNIEDYLDSAENTDYDSIFDTNKLKTNQFNDQTFVVAP